MGNTLADLASKATEAPTGNGLAKLASNKIDAKKRYQAYAIEAQSNGETPKSFEEWVSEQG